MLSVAPPALPFICKSVFLILINKNPYGEAILETEDSDGGYNVPLR